VSSLAGKRVLVTRPRAQTAGLAALLRKAGALPLLLPLIEIVPPVDMAALDHAARAAASYDWLVFTSANAVDALWDRLEHLGLPTKLPARTAVIGPSTARALERRGQPVDYMPTVYTDEALTSGFSVKGDRILFPRAEDTREVVAARLRARGAAVDEVIAYRNQPADLAAEAEMIAEVRRGIDVVVLASGSAASQFARIVETYGLPIPPVVACIGPESARVAMIKGLTVNVVATVHTAEGLVDAIVEHFSLEVL
jgi:uroporphyrinogen-III synthase